MTQRGATLWLAIAAALQLVSNGNWILPLAVWLAPVFTIRFYRGQPVVRGYLLLSLVTFVTVAVAWRGIIPGPGYWPTVIGTALFGNLPLLADRLLMQRLPGFAGTLVYPVGVTVLEFAMLSTNPLGSFGSIAYTQYGSPALLQLVSVTGVWGLVFLISWLGPVANLVWERSLPPREIGRSAAVYVGVLAALLVLGSVRLALAPPPGDTVRVASFTAVDALANRAELAEAERSDWDAFRRITAERHARYLRRTVQEARAGAEIVLWPELAAIVGKEDEAALLARAAEIAHREDVYLAASLGTVYRDAAQPFENKLVLFDPTGTAVLEHVKYGGNRFEGSLRGDGILRTAETPHGMLSAVICWDTDFLSNVRQAGRNGTDILLSPSLDWRAIDPLHSHMAVFRAIENGVAVVRHADNGLSLVTDAYGRVLAAVDHFSGGQRVMVAQVPTRGTTTVYARIGDAFAWLCALGLIGLCAAALRRGPS